MQDWQEEILNADNETLRTGIMKTPITPIRLPLDLKEAAKIQAKKDGMNLSQFIIKAIDGSLNYKCEKCGSRNIYADGHSCSDCNHFTLY